MSGRSTAFKSLAISVGVVAVTAFGATAASAVTGGTLTCGPDSTIGMHGTLVKDSGFNGDGSFQVRATSGGYLTKQFSSAGYKTWNSGARSGTWSYNAASNSHWTGVAAYCT